MSKQKFWYLYAWGNICYLNWLMLILRNSAKANLMVAPLTRRKKVKWDSSGSSLPVNTFWFWSPIFSSSRANPILLDPKSKLLIQFCPLCFQLGMEQVNLSEHELLTIEKIVLLLCSMFSKFPVHMGITDSFVYL